MSYITNLSKKSILISCLLIMLITNLITYTVIINKHNIERKDQYIIGFKQGCESGGSTGLLSGLSNPILTNLWLTDSSFRDMILKESQKAEKKESLLKNYIFEVDDNGNTHIKH